MSNAAEADDNVCANCGIAAVDDIKLEECTDCDLVRYCSKQCRGDHRQHHEEECKIRSAELHELFTQPEGTHLGECPLCFLPLPLANEKSTFNTCCSEIICNGCFYTNIMCNSHDKGKAGACVFCREPLVNGDEEQRKRMMERAEVNDPAATREIGRELCRDGDYDGAFEYLTKAAEFGDVDAHYLLGNMYLNGEGVDEDDEKLVYHYEKAAIGGHFMARHILGRIEEGNGNTDRAVKHLIIAAKLGYEISMKQLWDDFKDGNITKEDLDTTLRTHQAAIDETKSEQRDAADAFFRERNYYRS
jgi:tetratricopeptide (TPR) repeat protein